MTPTYELFQVLTIQDDITNETYNVVVTKIEIKNGETYLFIRRQDNKPFRGKRYNVWIKG